MPLSKTLNALSNKNELKIRFNVDFDSLTVSGTSALSDHYNKANIDSLLVEKASLANPRLVGTVTTPNLTVVIDATVDGNLSVSGAERS